MRMQKTKQTFVMTNLSFDFVGTILVLSASAERPLFIVCALTKQNHLLWTACSVEKQLFLKAIGMNGRKQMGKLNN